MHYRVFGLTEKSLILNWIVDSFTAGVCFIVNFICAILNRGKKKVVPPVNNYLLQKSASKLAQDIREGKCKSADVVQAYIDRILQVEPYINATAEKCFESALEKAKEVDVLVASGKFTKEQLSLEKPLLGVPISIKCLFHVKDVRCAGGSLFYSDLVSTEDAPAVAALKNAGAIVIATTNAPEFGLHMETTNNVYGRTCNPYDTSRIAGGSSGGEAALIAAGASVLGLGNDLLGSVRLPAHLSGVFSHKPSRGLVSNYGSIPFETPGIPGSHRDANIDNFLASGPLCRYAEDLLTSMKVLTLDKEVKKRFDDSVDFKKVKIYYLREIRSPFVVPVEKDIATALENAVSYFEKQHKITPIEVKMPCLFDMCRCTLTMVGSSVKRVKKSLCGPKGLRINNIPEFFKYLIGKSKLYGSTIGLFVLISNPLLCRKREMVYYQEMLEKWMDELNKILDKDSVLLMPTLPFTAPYHSGTFPYLLSTSYTGIFNALGLPATHCPMGLNKDGLPHGITIVGCQNNDPLTIACAIELERAFGGWKPILKTSFCVFHE